MPAASSLFRSGSLDDAINALRSHQTNDAPTNMRATFQSKPGSSEVGRFQQLSVQFDDMLIDFSKCAINQKTLSLLEGLAGAAHLADRRDAMFAGEPINTTEDRAVLHTALRNQSNSAVYVDGENVMPDVQTVLEAMAGFASGIRSGEIAGVSGQRFTDIVNIGIGGSDLGPAMTTLALAPYHDGPKAHYVSNIDGAHIADVLSELDPAQTLIIVASKTFTTIETMTNAQTARKWISDALGEVAIRDHFCAVSTALDKVADFGMDESRVFGFWDWVGGRYSIWSAIGLPLMIAIGPESFNRFLAGGHAMDEHFKNAAPLENLPMLLGLVGYYHREICGHPSRAIIPYDQRLSRFAAYLQQLDMESNGKRVALDGTALDRRSGPIVWGEPGTNSQHAFFQLLHQGTDVIPVEFMIAANGHEPELAHQHELLMANCLAQSEALMWGRTHEEARDQLIAKGVNRERAEELAPHRVFTGNRPSITILYDRLDPFTLGKLIALYEHRVFVEAQIFGINAFDQWGVELGKELATALLPVVAGDEDADSHDASTQGLVAALQARRKK